MGNKSGSRFPISLAFMYLGILLLMSGIHTGIIVLMKEWNINAVLQSIIPILYWSVIAAGLTLFTRMRIKKTYDAPLIEFAEATKQVAGGDFSVYVNSIHTADKLDYLDHMIMDFNKMVEELGSIETLKTDFFSNVSHEIKTPIAVIQNSAIMLEKAKEHSEEEKEYINNILLSSKKLNALITNILKLNKLEKQNILPDLEYYDLAQQLCECIVQFDDLLEGKNLELEVVMEDCIPISGDKDLLELVWTNLFSNAIKFTDTGVIRLEVKTVTSENMSLSSMESTHLNEKQLKQKANNLKQVQVIFGDTGCGMTEATMQHIFDKFYQGDTSHATLGNGLGLALSYRIIQMLNGSIQVKSELGKGTVFTVDLPIRC